MCSSKTKTFGKAGPFQKKRALALEVGKGCFALYGHF